MAPENAAGRTPFPGHLGLASMGPGPDGPGKHPTADNVNFRVCKLQWGRGRMAPENAQEGGGLLHGLDEASMGPGPDGPGKLKAIAGWRDERQGFNGAGAGWPRKTKADSVTDLD